MSSLSYGLNITKKPQVGQRPPPAKRKTIFDNESDPEDKFNSEDENSSEDISTIGGLRPSKPKPSLKPKHILPSKPSKPPKSSQYGDLSTNHNTHKHSQTAQDIDPSIYDYDAVYDSLHAPTPTSRPSSTSPTNPTNPTHPSKAPPKPKYMTSLLAAAETRKRDALRAKEKMLAKEREAEGDEFTDKEKFVTGAYQRQQEEMRRLEAEEKVREEEAERRRGREGMRGLYVNLLEEGEERHRRVLRNIEEGRGKGRREEGDGEGGKKEKEKSEVEIAREKGVAVNEEGVVVDKRELLSAGLNAGAAPKARKVAVPRESRRERETRLFEEGVLGKRGHDRDEDGGEGREAKSRRLEDELLSMGSP